MRVETIVYQWRNGNRDDAKSKMKQLATSAAAGSAASLDTLLDVTRQLELARVPISDVLVNNADIDDAEQTTLLAVALHIHQYEGRAGYTGWLRSIARNEALQVIRRKQRRTEVPLGTHEGIWTEKLSSQIANRETLQAAINELDSIYREPLELRETHGLDYQTIADQLGIELGTVRSRINRARSQIAGKLRPPATD